MQTCLLAWEAFFLFLKQIIQELVIRKVAVDEEAAVVWELEDDSLEISAILEEVAVVGVGRVGAI